MKNKLDGQVYAIKRIRLNPSSKHFSESKITREVSLLSQLHHENIVRYALPAVGNPLGTLQSTGKLCAEC